MSPVDTKDAPEAAAASVPNGEEPIGNGKTLGLVLVKQQKMLSAVMPEWMTVERFMRQVILAAQHEPKLLKCTTASVLKAVTIAAQLGLEPNGILGSGYMIPFKNKHNENLQEAQFIPGYRGLLDLARRTGELFGANVKPVFVGEVFNYEEGSSPFIKHFPNLDAQAAQRLPDKLRGTYVVAVFPKDYKQYGYMGRAEIESIRARSRSGDTGPWKTDYVAMAMKSVIRREAKYWPLSPEKARYLMAAIEQDTRVETGETGGVDAEVLRDTEASISERVREKTEQKTESLKERVAARKKATATARVVPNDPDMEAELKRQEEEDRNAAT